MTGSAELSRAETLLREMFDVAVSAAQPAICVPPFLPPEPDGGRLVVIGAGKASAAMARAAEIHYGKPLDGIVVTRYGHAVTCDGVEIVEAAHPVPDAAGRDAARRILAFAEGLTARDTVLCMISGGGSALMSLPAEGVSRQPSRFMSVDLPEPDGPISATKSPGARCSRREPTAERARRSVQPRCFRAAILAR